MEKLASFVVVSGGEGGGICSMQLNWNNNSVA